VLANLALDGLESLLAEQFCSHSRQAARNKVHLVRYADDFVITGSSQQLLETQVKPLLQQFLAQRGLELSLEKTRITHIEDGFDFLGQNVRKYDGKFLTKPSKPNVARFLANIREVVKENKATSAGNLVRLLHPKILGWAMYHRHICAKDTFAEVDHAIFETLWQGCVRRHPNKGKRWIARKYFTTVAGEGGGNHWVFYGEVAGRDGAPRPIALLQASRVRIRRHVKIRKDVNPYAPRWKEYLQRRHRREEYRSLPVGSEEPSLKDATVGVKTKTE
jgi:RNA-directed DNA polymerase